MSARNGEGRAAALNSVIHADLTEQVTFTRLKETRETLA